MVNKIKKVLSSNLKNMPGWTTNRKIVVFSVDDYGNIRVASRDAWHKMKSANVPGISSTRFDRLDGLDTTDDLTMLFETLMSVKDKNDNFAKFTPFANCANIDFEAIRENNFDHYRYELLPNTLNKLSGYENTWELWQQGIDNGIFVPQFHGREHLNVKLFNEMLSARDAALLSCIENNSFTGLPTNFYKTLYYNEAFSFDKFEENKELANILVDGLQCFNKVFGYKATNFNAPGAYEHSILESVMSAEGIGFIDSTLIKNEHQGSGIYKKKFRYFGKKNKFNQRYLIRNCVFEPTLTNSETAIKSCLQEIETAFFWKKPANISSHRVNFAGVIDSNNRKQGIDALKTLLNAIVKKWPDVEFMTSQQLGELIFSADK